MKFIRSFLFALLFIFLFTACNASCNASEVDTPTPQQESSNPADDETVKVPTLKIEDPQSPAVSEIPTSTATQAVTALPTSDVTPTPSPTNMVVVVIDTNELALRTGPGIYYELIDLYPEGTEVIVLGTEPARKWFSLKVG